MTQVSFIDALTTLLSREKAALAEAIYSSATAAQQGDLSSKIPRNQRSANTIFNKMIRRDDLIQGLLDNPNKREIIIGYFASRITQTTNEANTFLPIHTNNNMLHGALSNMTPGIFQKLHQDLNSFEKSVEDVSNHKKVIFSCLFTSLTALSAFFSVSVYNAHVPEKYQAPDILAISLQSSLFCVTAAAFLAGKGKIQSLSKRPCEKAQILETNLYTASIQDSCQLLANDQDR